MRPDTGPWLLLLGCCIWPLLCSGLSIWAYKRYQRRGLSSFIPKIRTEGLIRK